MPTDKETLEQRQQLRYKILRAMFDSTVGVSKDPNAQNYSPYDVSGSLKLPSEETSIAMQYLAGQNLIKKTQQGGREYYSRYKILHQGIVEIEKSIENPQARTDHFMLNVVQHFNAPVGSIQNAPNSTAQVIQNNDIGASLADVLSLIDELRAEAISKLPPEKQEEVKDELEVLKGEVVSKEGNPKRLKAIWNGIQKGTLATIDVVAKLATLAEKLKSLGLLDS